MADLIKALSFDEFKNRVKAELGFKKEDEFDETTEAILRLQFTGSVALRKWEDEVREKQMNQYKQKTLM